MKLHTVDLDPSPEVSAASRSATRGGSAGESLYSEEAWSEDMPSELKVQAGSLRGEVEVCHVSQSQCDGCFPSCISTCNISKRDVAGVSVCFLDLDQTRPEPNNREQSRMVLVIEGILLPVWVFTSIVYMKESSSRFRLRSRPVFELLVYIHHEFSVCGPQKQGRR